MDIRQFTEEEIAEINGYVIMQVPQSLLPEMFILSEEPYKKVKIFIAIFRILTGVIDFVETKDTKQKMIEFLSEYKEDYEKLYHSFIISENSSYAPKLQKRKLIFMLRETSLNLRINKLINSFLVFAEKQELISTDKVTGLNLDSSEGENLYNKLISGSI